MTFRLPLQIFRSAAKPLSQNQIFYPNLQKCLPRNNFSSLATVTNNRSLIQNSSACFTRQPLPRFPSLHRFIRTSLESKKKTKCPIKCQERKCKKLFFRSTTREDCDQCMMPVPDKCPKLQRPKPAYDESKLKWNHICPVDMCADSQRADDLRGYKVVPKKLPKLKDSDCKKCVQHFPTKAPKLHRPKRLYEYKKDPERICPEDTCNIDPPRMDDVVGIGYKINPRKLPVLKPAEDCPQCMEHVPTKAPKLCRPKRLYEYKKDPERICPEDTCNIDPPRMDDVVGIGYKINPRQLPILKPAKDCPKCVKHNPTKAPKLCRPKRLYEYKKDPDRICPEDTCNIDPPRMDDVVGIGYKINPRKLPKIPKGTCEYCAPYQPTYAPELNRPKRLYEYKKDPERICPEDTCNIDPPRMDDVVGIGYKINPRKLPVLKPAEDCPRCIEHVPTKAPKLSRPKREYEYKKDPKRICPEDTCNIDPPRMDDVLGIGYKINPRKLPVLKPAEDCPQCMEHVPTKAPKLGRPKRLYEYKKDPDRNCPEDTCNIDPPRMDNVLGIGYKINPRKLPVLKPAEDCPQCMEHVPTKAPKLCRPKRLYEYKKDPDRICPEDTCNIDPPRMDDVVGIGYKINPRKLPILKPAKDCPKCVKHNPTKAPKLCRPKRLYEYKKDPERICPEDTCNIDPPRMDDVLCWKPKKKVLPAFNSNARHYSTFATSGNKAKYCINSSTKYMNRYHKAYINSRQYSKKSKKESNESTKKQKSMKPKDCLRACPKFKVKHCKPVARKFCEDHHVFKVMKKVEPPYTSYGDMMDGFWEKERSECEDTYQIMMQPQKQVQGHFYKLKAPPPYCDHIDPALERKCLANKLPDPEPLEEPQKWVNSCPSFKLAECGKKARQYCNEKPEEPPCQKLEAPYKSFSDRCPQFPELELNECEVVEKLKENYMVDYSGGSQNPEFDNVRSPTDKKNAGKKCKCSVQKEIKIEGEKCKCVPGPNVTKCESKQGVHTMECLSKTSDKHYICACKPVSGGDSKSCASSCSKPGSAKSKKRDILKPIKKPKSKCGGKKVSSKAVICSSKDGSKKIVCLCKEVQSKGSVDCKPKKVSSKPKSTKSSRKCKSKTSPKRSCCGFKLSDMNPPPPPPPSRSSLLARICAYFRARPNCPAPHEWKQKLLEEKARKAATAAGLQICEPKCKNISIDKFKCAEKLKGPKKKKPKCEQKVKCCAMPKKKKSKCKPKKPSCCSKSKKKKAKCKPSGCSKSKKNKPKKPSTCSKTNKKCSGAVSNGMSKTRIIICKPGASVKTNGPTTSKTQQTCEPHLQTHKKYFATVFRTIKHFTTYARCKADNNQMKKKTKQNKMDTTLGKISHSYLRLNNNYVGKMYKVTLKKIGIKNALIRHNPEEDPYTICHVCKVIPKHQILYNPDVKNLNIKIISNRKKM